MKIKKFLSVRMKFGQPGTKSKKKGTDAPASTTDLAPYPQHAPREYARNEVWCSGFSNQCFAMTDSGCATLPSASRMEAWRVQNSKGQLCADWLNGAPYPSVAAPATSVPPLPTSVPPLPPQIQAHQPSEPIPVSMPPSVPHEGQQMVSSTHIGHQATLPRRSRIRTNPWIRSGSPAHPRRPHSDQQRSAHSADHHRRAHSSRRAASATDDHPMAVSFSESHRVVACPPAAALRASSQGRCPPIHTDWYYDGMSSTLPLRGVFAGSRECLSSIDWKQDKSSWRRGAPQFIAPLPTGSPPDCCLEGTPCPYEPDSAYSTLATLVNEDGSPRQSSESQCPTILGQTPPCDSTVGHNIGVRMVASGDTLDSGLSGLMIQSQSSSSYLAHSQTSSGCLTQSHESSGCSTKSQESSVGSARSDYEISSPENDSGLFEMESQCTIVPSVHSDQTAQVTHSHATTESKPSAPNTPLNSRKHPFYEGKERRRRPSLLYIGSPVDGKAVVPQPTESSRQQTSARTRSTSAADKLTEKIERLCLAKEDIQNKIKEAQAECDLLHNQQKAVDSCNASLLTTIGDLQSKIDGQCESMKQQFPHLFR